MKLRLLGFEALCALAVLAGACGEGSIGGLDDTGSPRGAFGAGDPSGTGDGGAGSSDPTPPGFGSLGPGGGEPYEEPVCGPEVYVDPVSGNDGNAGTVDQPWQTLEQAKSHAESQRGSAEETCIHLAPGNYGAFVWDPGDFTETVTWKAIDTTNKPKFDRIEMICSPDCTARQTFDGFDIHLPSGVNPEATVRIGNVNDLEIRNSEVHNEDLYGAIDGIKITGSDYVRVRNSDIHDVVHAVRYNGDGHLFDNNHVYRFAGSGVSMLCGGIGGRAQSSRFTTISNNHIHDHAGDYPSEPGYSCCDQPDELHASMIAVRGSDLTVHGNWIYDIQESVNLQFYLGDCGVSNYQIQNITITNNVMYNVSQSSFLQSSASPVGPIVVRNNTLLDGFLNVDLSKPSGLGYNGAGTIVNDNLVLNGLGCASNQNGDSYLNPNSDWVCESNVYNSLMFMISQAHPSNTEVGNDRSFFRNAMANPQSETGACQPLGSASCDLRPDPGHSFCTGGANGGYIGAIPCSGSQ